MVKYFLASLFTIIYSVSVAAASSPVPAIQPPTLPAAALTVVPSTPVDQEQIQNQEQQDADKARSVNFNKLFKKNFITYIFPKAYYENSFSEVNSQLPPVIFYSYIAGEAFKNAENGNLPALRYFLQKYDFAEVKDEAQKRNILISTVISGNLDSARVILMRKVVDVNNGDLYGKTALHYAVSAGDMEMTKLLLTMGASSEAKDSTGLQPIDYLTSVPVPTDSDDEAPANIVDQAPISTSDAEIKQLLLEY